MSEKEEYQNDLAVDAFCFAPGSTGKRILIDR